MTQQKFTSDLLSEFHYDHFSPISTLLDASLNLTTDMGTFLTDPSIYRRLVGKLKFLQHTRPDICYVVQHLSQFLQASQVPHLMADIYVLRYLLSAPDLGLLFNKDFDFSLLAYSNSDWAACALSRHSVTGFFVTLGESIISWKSKKQPKVSLSSTEAEYKALQKVMAEISWLVHLLNDFGVCISHLILVYCDSQATLYIARNPVFHERTKHIEIDYHYVRDCVNVGLVSLHYVCSVDQLADVFTKSLPGLAHYAILGKLGVYAPSSLRGGWNYVVYTCVYFLFSLGCCIVSNVGQATFISIGPLLFVILVAQFTDPTRSISNMYIYESPLLSHRLLEIFSEN